MPSQVVINVTRREPNSPRARRLTGTELHPLRPRLIDILIDHAPDHLHNADLLLQRYVGQEELLLKALEKKFSIASKATSRTPSDDKPPAPPTLPAGSLSNLAPVAKKARPSAVDTSSQDADRRTAAPAEGGEGQQGQHGGGAQLPASDGGAPEGGPIPDITVQDGRVEHPLLTAPEPAPPAAAEGPHAYSRAAMELCAPLPLRAACEASAVALLGAGATTLVLRQPSRAYRVMTEGLNEMVLPALRTTLGQADDGTAQQHPSAEPRHGAIAELEGGVSGGVPEYRGLSRGDVDAVRGWLGVPTGAWGAALAFALPPVAAAGYSFARPPGTADGGLNEAAESLRRLITEGVPAGGRQPRIIAKVDARAGAEAALAALTEAAQGPIDEVLVLTGSGWSGGDAVGEAAEAVVQGAPAQGLCAKKQ